MPVTKSAIIALRKDKRRRTINIRRKKRAKKAVDAVKNNPSTEKLSYAYRMLDRLVKWHLIHKNKAARLKSKLSRLQRKTPSK